MGDKAYLNGDLVDVGQAAVTVVNPSLLHGVGLFETLRVYEGRPFRLAAHVARMRASAEKLELPVGQALEQVPDAIDAVLEANRLTEARVRFTVSPPTDANPENVTLLVSGQAFVPYPDELYAKGMTVFICNQYRQSAQDPVAGHKTTSFFPRLIALRDAQNHQCGEALWFTPANLLAEGCISNVFVVKDGRLTTPPVDTPVLPGVTRGAILELAARLEIPADEVSCTIDDLLGADEVFLTNSGWEVMPVTGVERRAIGDEEVGAVTRRLTEAFRELIRGECPPGRDA